MDDPPRSHRPKWNTFRFFALVGLCLLSLSLLTLAPAKAHAAISAVTDPSNPAIQYADSHWNCRTAACTSTVSEGSAQPDFQCAEFVARSLSAEGLVPGLNPGSAAWGANSFGEYVYNGKTYSLNQISPIGVPTIYDYLIESGVGRDIGDNLGGASPGDAVVYYDSNNDAEHIVLLVAVGATAQDSLIDAHNNAHYHLSLQSENSGFHHKHIVHIQNQRQPQQLLDVNGDGRPDLIGKDASGNLYAYPHTNTSVLSPSMWGARVLVGTGWNMYNWILFGDVNDDGFPDILGRDPSGNLYAYPHASTLSLGTGTWGNRVLVGTGWNMYNWIALGNVHNAGHPSVLGDLLGRDAAGNLYAYPHTTTTTLSTATWGNRVQVGNGWNMYSQIGLAELGQNNAAGFNSAEMVGEDSSGNLYAYPNSDSGTLNTSTFGGRILIGTGWNMYSNFFAGDITGDGHPELLGLDASGGLYAYLSNGSSTVGFNWGSRVLIGTGWNMYTQVF